MLSRIPATSTNELLMAQAEHKRQSCPHQCPAKIIYYKVAQVATKMHYVYMSVYENKKQEAKATEV